MEEDRDDWSVMVTPSTFHIWLPPESPLDEKAGIWPDSEPPTLTRSVLTPGSWPRMTQGSRADGMLAR